MRRSPVSILVLALVASVLAVVTFSAASATPPGDTSDTGELTVTPATPVVGDVVELKADFPTSTASSTVTFYKKIGDVWSSIDTDESNTNGNAYLDHQVNEAQDVYARITSGSPAAITETENITPTPAPVIQPDGDVTGVLGTDPATFSEGDKVKVSANFPNGTFLVTLYKETAPDVWTKVATDQSSSSGNAYFPDFPISGEQKVFARKNNGEQTEPRVLKPSPKVTLGVKRDCSGNDCSAGTATASGATTPVTVGRSFQLQFQGGSGWVNVGSPVASGANGKLTIQFSLAGAPQWTPRTYRLFSAADGSNPEVISNTRSFMPGPETLGKNVLRVDVENGIFPTRKGPEYAARATVSEGGIVNPKINNVKVEDFGVRGTSTASYTKKPYKLKFDKSPKDSTTGVFGMGADKSWTLLASFLDQSYVRDKVGLDLGRRVNALGPQFNGAPARWTPDSRFVELFVNDQYRGSYLMTESVKVDGDRVNVDPQKGMIMEVDNSISSAIDFLSTIGQIVFAFKDPDEFKKLDDGVTPDPESVTNAKVTAVKARINAFEKKLYSSSGRDEYENFLDEEAAIDFMLIKEFTKDNDADFNSSHYFSWTMDSDGPPTEDHTPSPLDDGKFHFGPVWDFDRSAGNVDPDSAGHTYMSSPNGWVLRGTGTRSDSGRQLYTTHWFVQLFKASGFKNAVEARWLEIRDEFKKVGDAEVAALEDELGAGFSNDRNRWKNEPKRYRSEAGKISFVTQWYKDRYTWMNGQLT